MMMRRKLTLLGGAGLLFALAVIGCAPAASTDNGGTTSRPITSIDDVPKDECNLIHNINACFVGGQPPADIPFEEYWGLFMQATDDLNKRAGVQLRTVKLAKIERAEWSDTSLGNPQLDRMYAQVITPGFKMVLVSGGKTYTYHTSLDHVVFVRSEQA